MRHSLLAFCFSWLLLPGVSAQTTGDPASGDLSINGLGSLETSPAGVLLDGSGVLTVELESTNNPGQPILLLAASSPIPGAIPFGNTSTGAAQSLDLRPLTLQVVLDGTSGGFSSLFSIPASGVPFSITGGAFPNGLPLQGAVTGATSPLGFDMTQALTVIVPYTTGSCTATTNLSPLSDDGSVLVPFANGPFPFFGVSYTECFVNMNGNITFTSGNTDFTSTEAEMLSDQPRIAVCWDDFSPQDTSQGTVRVQENATSIDIEWFNVRHFGSSACGGGQDSNTFCTRLNYVSGNMFIDFGYMGLCNGGGAPSTDQLVGVSPGGSISAPNNVDITSGINTAPTPTSALYEDFGQSFFGPFDLSGSLGGNPVLTCWIATGGAGVGPYRSDVL